MASDFSLRRIDAAPGLISVILLAVLVLAAGCVTAPQSTDHLALSDLSPEGLAAKGLPTQWVLVWNDEFSGREIADHWTHEVNAWGGGNNELQYYTDRSRNSRVRGGTLQIIAHEEDYTGPEGQRDYTSARMISRYNGDWKYGMFEIRAKLPDGPGMWPAIWMMPTDEVYGGWAASGEIDIMEMVGYAPGEVHGTIHYGAEWPDNASLGRAFTLPTGEKFIDNFHTFTLIWQETEMHWYVDGEHYSSINNWRTDGHDFPAPFDQRFYMILNLAVGGNWPGPPNSLTSFPQRLVIDYVRVYQTPE